MPKAFKRIQAAEIEHLLETGEMPEALTTALEAAVKNARENDEYDGEAPIEVFITADNLDEDDEEEAS